MDFYVSPVTLLFESSLISIVSLTPEQLLVNTRTNNMEKKENKDNKDNKEKKDKKHKLKKD
jgi:hypothetical protein